MRRVLAHREVEGELNLSMDAAPPVTAVKLVEMSHAASHPTGEVALKTGEGAGSIPAALRGAMDVLVGALLLITAGRSIIGQAPGWEWVMLCAAAVGAVYALGTRLLPAAAEPSAVGWWFFLLLGTWILLLVLTPDAIYLAFAWFFLLLHLLPRPAALGAIALTTAAAVAGFGWHQDTFTPGMVIGPVLGAGVAISTVFGYQALRAESEQRRRLIIELDRTRHELAAVQHRAGVLDERERLAREIHDTLAQGFSSIQLLLQAANRSLDPTREVDPVRAGGLIEQARRAAQDNLAEARRVVAALAPGDLQESTLPAALQRLCESTTARTGITVAFHLAGPAPLLDTPVEVALLRIAQGALGNTEQHSGATRADVTLTSMDTKVSLDVLDNGVGFDPQTVTLDHAPRERDTGQGGFGLWSMRSRAADRGGVLSVESAPGGGTAISVHLNAHADPLSPDGARGPVGGTGGQQR